jgi:hypothetical protein
MSDQHVEGLRGPAGVSLSGFYPDQRVGSRTEALDAQPSMPKKRSPLPPVREIDAALQAKYGAKSYRGI